MAGISVYIGTRGGATVLAVAAIAAAVALTPVITGGGGGGSCTTTISSGSVSTALNSLTAGGTLCLNAGTYSYTDSTINKASMTTVQAADGLDNSDVTITTGVDVQSSNNLKFQTMTIDGAQMGTGSVTATNIQFVDIAFTDGLCILVPGTNSSRGLLVDSSTFINAGRACGNEGRLTVNGLNTSHSNGYDQGIVIQDSLFQGSGPDATNCADGIQLTGDAAGVTVDGNTFYRIRQHPIDLGYQAFDCDDLLAHVDPFQIYGAEYVRINGNFFYDNSTGLMSGDCNGSPLIVTNNVWTTDGSYGDQALVSGATSSTFSHNTVASSNLRTSGNGCSSFAGTVTNNIIGGLTGNAPTGTVNYNLSPVSSLRGANGINGSPTYVGGASPSTWAGHVLTGGSLGKAAASDGLDMGVNP